MVYGTGLLGWYARVIVRPLRRRCRAVVARDMVAEGFVNQAYDERLSSANLHFQIAHREAGDRCRSLRRLGMPSWVATGKAVFQ
jgi:hypothetical protein